jgi:biotin carboxyl carrier protein
MASSLKLIMMSTSEDYGSLNIDDSLYKTRLSSKFTKRKAYQPPDPRNILSFIPGTVLDILITPGKAVKKGDELMVLDAMKMQNLLKCPIDGKVKAIKVKKGDKVSKGTVLIELE